MDPIPNEELNDSIDRDENDDLPDNERYLAEQKPPALTIQVQSWATPIVGLLMLVVGLLGGYFGRPLVSPAVGETASSVSAAVASSDAQSPAATVPPGPDSATRQEMMDFLIAQTRHFKGDAEAPVTIIEFGDFQ